MNEPHDTGGPRQAPSQATRDLEARIAQARRDYGGDANGASSENPRDMTGLARGLRIGSEFVAAILVGAGIGFLIDLGLGTRPWGMLILFMVGFAAGIRNVIQVVAELNGTAASAPPAQPAGSEDTADQTRNR